MKLHISLVQSRFPSAELTVKFPTENSNRVRRRRGSTPERPTATATTINASISSGGRQQVVFHPESTPSMDYPGPEGRMEGSVVVQKFVRAKGIA
jgi:hypothetical protein